jgi:FkbM family methyltransferase
MLSVFKKKLTTAQEIWKTHGIKEVALVYPRKFDAWLRHEDNWWVGKAVEARGNVVSLDGCTFSLKHPDIATAHKSALVFGRYEAPEREALGRFLDPTLPVVEFGGSIGVVACLTNKMLESPKNHVVVEANPTLVGLLEENRARNQCVFVVLNRAVAYLSDKVAFNIDPEDFLASSVQRPSAHSVEVQTITLEKVLQTYGFEVCTLICDIEGGEADLIMRESASLAQNVGTLILEVHHWVIGRLRTNELMAKLKEIGFEKIHERGATLVFQNARFGLARS